MKKIQLNARFKIHAGQLEQAKELAATCIEIVKEKEAGKGALQYDWFLSPDNSEFVVRETYTDSDAVLTHMANLGDPLGKLLQISDFELEIYGNPSEELQKAGAALNPKVYLFYGGLFN